MAAITGHADVGTGEPEAGLIVIVVTTAPAERAVALAARLLELTMVHIVFAMALGAGQARRRLTPKRLGLVAGSAFECTMCILQRKIRELMIKLGAVDLHDVGGATFVVGMTRLAFADSRIRH
jgi:hypothetical protein